MKQLTAFILLFASAMNGVLPLLSKSVQRLYVHAPLAMALYDGDKAAKAQIGQAEMLLVAPIEAIRMDEVKWIRSNLPKDTKTSVLSRQALIRGIDGTPFVQLADGVVGSSFCIFVSEKDSEKAIGAFSKWTRSLTGRISEEMSKNSNIAIPQVSFYMAKRDGTCVRVPVPSFDQDNLEEAEEGLVVR